MGRQHRQKDTHGHGGPGHRGRGGHKRSRSVSHNERPYYERGPAPAPGTDRFGRDVVPPQKRQRSMSVSSRPGTEGGGGGGSFDRHFAPQAQGRRGSEGAIDRRRRGSECVNPWEQPPQPHAPPYREAKAAFPSFSSIDERAHETGGAGNRGVAEGAAPNAMYGAFVPRYFLFACHTSVYMR